MDLKRTKLIVELQQQMIERMYMEEKVLRQKEFESVSKQNALRNHFGQILITARQRSDFYALLPYPLHHLINLISHSFNYGSTLSNEEILQFKQENKDTILILNRLLFFKSLNLEDEKK